MASLFGFGKPEDYAKYPGYLPKDFVNRFTIIKLLNFLDSSAVSWIIAHDMHTTPPHMEFRIKRPSTGGDEIFVFIREPLSGSLFLPADGGRL